MRQQIRILQLALFALCLALALWAAQATQGRGPAPYDIQGATVQTAASCGPLGRYVTHLLIATDGQAQRYNLQLETADLIVSHVGLIAVEGQALIWLTHRRDDQAIVVLAGGPCDAGAPLLSDRWYAWAPLLVR